MAMAKQALVGNKLRRLRREQKLTQVDMAARLGISPSYLNLIEHNQRALTLPLLLKLGEDFGVDLETFSGDEEARLIADLTEIFGDPLFRDMEFDREELQDLAGTAPGVAQAILGLYRAYRSARDDALGLSERLSENPFLTSSSHQLLTLLTSIRSFSEILRDNVDLATTKRQQFVGILVEESEKLTDRVNELFDFFGGEGLQRSEGADSPAEEVTDFVQAHSNHFPELETAAEELRRESGLEPAGSYPALIGNLAAEHGVGVKIVSERDGEAPPSHYDPEERCLFLSEALPPASATFLIARQIGLMARAAVIDARLDRAALASAEARELARTALANYLAGAMLMPYEAFQGAARELRHDLDRLQQRFGASFEQVCHRLTTLQRPGAEGVPVHFLRVDVAGNILKRFSGSGLRIPRFGGACPRWNVHTAFMNPGQIDVQVAQLPDGTTYLFLARAIVRPDAGFRAPKSLFSVAIGCEASYARNLVYADGLDLSSPGLCVPVGIHCRQCERKDCRQRAFPSLLD
jgi:predicted transcriptional regulator/transcriptional regulator with XRE-family HTH domain